MLYLNAYIVFQHIACFAFFAQATWLLTYLRNSHEQRYGNWQKAIMYAMASNW